LGNHELYDKLVGHLFDNLTQNNVIRRLRQNELCEHSVDAELDFLASNFGELLESIHSDLTVDDLYRIFSRSSFRIETEDWLFAYIDNNLESHPEYFGLFEFVRFEFLSAESLSVFVQRTSDFEINSSILAQLLPRLKLPVKLKKSPSDRSRYRCRSKLRFPPSQGSLAGIVSFLFNSASVKGVAMRLSELPPNELPVSITQFNSDSAFESTDKQNQWISYDFMEMRVKPTHYAVRSVQNDFISNHLASWVIEISESGTHWVEIDRKDNDNTRSAGGIRLFEVKTADKCRFFRIRSTGINHLETNTLRLQAFEVFGTLVQPEHCTFVDTESERILQRRWTCRTCSFAGISACCDACARICHAGHDLVDEGYQLCFCDCGTQRYGQCLVARRTRP
jgi:hypothetical protein